VIAAGLLAATLSCHRSSAGGTPDTGAPVSIATTIQRHSAELLEISGVVGVAEGERDGQPVVQILVERRTPGLLARLPATLDGHPVVVIETGEIRSQDSARR
jgi:hypothetical protein